MWTSPACSDSDTRSSASTPGKRLVMPRSSSRGDGVPAMAQPAPSRLKAAERPLGGQERSDVGAVISGGRRVEDEAEVERVAAVGLHPPVADQRFAHAEHGVRVEVWVALAEHVRDE